MIHIADHFIVSLSDEGQWYCENCLMINPKEATLRTCTQSGSHYMYKS